MEWVETTGKSVEDATALALDQLGVDESEADIEVLEEPRQGMFGRVRGNARVKARIRPTAPPAKGDRNRRAKKRSGGSDRSGQERSGDGGGSRRDDSSGGRESGGTGSREGGSRGGASKGAGRSRGDGDRAARSGGADSKKAARQEREPMPEAEQRSVGEDFLTGLLDAMGLSGTVTSSLDEEGILAFEVDGESLGLLIGPGLITLDAAQEVCRNAIQRQADGREYGKVVLDVSSARRDRTAALEEFVRNEAEQVVSTGEEVVFEVMSRSDRKIVHDVVSGLDGVETESVGEDPRRRVVLRAG